MLANCDMEAVGDGVGAGAEEAATGCAGAAQPLMKIKLATRVAPPIFIFMVKAYAVAERASAD